MKPDGKPVRVTDHAVLRYLERVLEVDVEGLRAAIAEACERHQGAPAVKVAGAHFILDKGVVFTCLSEGSVPRYALLSRLLKE